jgi:fatty acyl-CoA reductase
VLVHKLLRSTKIRRIYALVRTEPGSDPQERLEGIWSTFAPLSAAFMKAEKRVIAIRGDITAGPNLGMTDEMVEKLKRECSIVMNLSADINLAAKAAQLVHTNILGALAVADLASRMPQLKRFVGRSQPLLSKSGQD